MLIFDLDGTLIDSIEGIAYSMNQILINNVLPAHDKNQYKKYVGNGWAELVRQSLLENNRKSENLETYIAQMNDLYNKYWDYKMLPYRRILDLLNKLKEQEIQFCINTNKTTDIANEIVQRFFKDFNFTHVIGQSHKLNKKPAPDGVLNIITELNLDKRECLYIGDGEVDIKTAKNSGIRSISVTWGFRSIEELIESGAELIVDKPKDLLKIINRGNV